MTLRELAHSIAPATAARWFMAELASQVWAADARVVEALLSEMSAALPAMRGEGFGGQAAERPYAVRGRSAVLSMRGLMLPSGPGWLEKYFGVVISERMIDRIREAQSDPEVDDILLEVDSPGGAVLGTQAFAEAIAGSAKPVRAHVLHMAASAALYVVSQASEIVARPGALIGSIGTYAVMVDASRMAEDAGIKVHVIRAGEHKGVGTFGAPITDKQLAEVQSRVDKMNDGFVAAVARGRGLTEAKVRELATGKTWDAAEALGLGLIDDIEDMRSGGADRADKKESTTMAMTPAELERQQQLEAQNRELTEKLSQLGGQLGTAKAETERERVKADGLRATIAAQDGQAKKALIDEAASNEGPLAGRVVPANRAAIEKVAEHSSVEELRAYLAELPVVTRSKQIGHGGSKTPATTTPAAIGGMSDGEKRFFSRIGITAQDTAKFGEVQKVLADGTMIKKDGTEIPAAQEA